MLSRGRGTLRTHLTVMLSLAPDIFRTPEIEPQKGQFVNVQGGGAGYSLLFSPPLVNSLGGGQNVHSPPCNRLKVVRAILGPGQPCTPLGHHILSKDARVTGVLISLNVFLHVVTSTGLTVVTNITLLRGKNTSLVRDKSCPSKGPENQGLPGQRFAGERPHFMLSLLVG